jgi:predicted helicase
MPKWKRFERLTAALHVLKTRGAEVKWNVECKDHKSPVEQGEVAEFVVKCKKTGANKGIMVSASGFQSGAARLAQEEGIEIFTLNEVAADWPDRVQASVLVPYVGERAVPERLGCRGADFRQVGRCVPGQHRC